MNGIPTTEELSRIGLRAAPTEPQDEPLLPLYINLRLRYLGLPTFPLKEGPAALDALTSGLVALSREKDRLLSHVLCPADRRIQNYLDSLLGEAAPQLPATTFVLDRHGLARTLSLPPDRDHFESPIVSSYRVRQGVLHNPRSDRRTTEGLFHIAESGLPIPDDKKAVPVDVFGQLLAHALRPPAELAELPFLSTLAQQSGANATETTRPTGCFLSLLLRPVICPSVAGVSAEKSMEIRFFAPGNLVCNLDFVESIFGNAGDPRLPENDAALDPEHWSGHTGCVILAPHLTRLTKRELGLPHRDEASPRQQRDGMCWREPDELYNDGKAFKVTARDASGVIVTLLSDNYFGYCKKEVKTQISYATNLYGLAEEEHAGGALLFTRYDLSEDFEATRVFKKYPHRLEDALALLGEHALPQPDGSALDREYPGIVYVPADARFTLTEGANVTWQHAGRTVTHPLRVGHVYILPSGYKVHLEKPRDSRTWRLVGTNAEGMLAHKPCTVSGGGKSEISKSLSDATHGGPVFVMDFENDFAQVAELLAHDYSQRFADAARRGSDQRPILSDQRSLGSVIKLLTPSRAEFSPEYNAWLQTIPQHIKELVFTVKRFYRPEWGADWRTRFGVDIVNGTAANELRFEGHRIDANFLRVGFRPDGGWRTFGLRMDFQPALKIQVEDDITSSVVVPRAALGQGLASATAEPSLKFVHNCEYRLFQRPDEAIRRGYDHQTESDFAQEDNFFSNYEALTTADARALVEDALRLDQFTPPMQALIRRACEGSPEYFVSSAHPRLVEGRPSKNPRYLQVRSNLRAPRETYVAQVGLHLARKVPLGQPVYTPVNAVLAGRRNNPAAPKAGIRSLAVYGPLHYMELPELFMEFICSLTGKSPSTTGAGSEGALTKGPFNALPPIYDLNATLVSYAVTGYAGFLSSAGCVGPKARVDHDISLLIPEVWCRMGTEERRPESLIAGGYLERCEDFEHAGRPVLASRLGYRITRRFVSHFCGRVFNHPHVVFSEEMLRPEKQSLDEFADGMDNIVSTQRAVAEHYFADGSIALACPPLRALLHLMRDGHYEGQTLADAAFRALFDTAAIRQSDWYRKRLDAKQRIDCAQWQRHCDYLESFLQRESYASEAQRLGIAERLRAARERLAHVQSPAYLAELHGTIGAEPSLAPIPTS
ncbi:hypothetical protein AXK11_01985 [Cephaloticoccus primus]|uniref:PPi-type phosphoenolpyruvate carboxykinase lobe 2 domain-containing protein n=1 Tax=Cephaloticoccus primus TaxID=1548207 RepID=A0A139SSZ5_9BACT|nr:hypothetical protein [Cephaloticoccus primus]KXU37591.1 hypothetical protein AXK11_01985 [Cephaloticoccus primus]